MHRFHDSRSVIRIDVALGPWIRSEGERVIANWLPPVRKQPVILSSAFIALRFCNLRIVHLAQWSKRPKQRAAPGGCESRSSPRFLQVADRCQEATRRNPEERTTGLGDRMEILKEKMQAIYLLVGAGTNIRKTSQSWASKAACAATGSSCSNRRFYAHCPQV